MLFLATPRDGAGYPEHAQGAETVRTRWFEIGICTLGTVDWSKGEIAFGANHAPAGWF